MFPLLLPNFETYRIIPWQAIEPAVARHKRSSCLWSLMLLATARTCCTKFAQKFAATATTAATKTPRATIQGKTTQKQLSYRSHDIILIGYDVTGILLTKTKYQYHRNDSRLGFLLLWLYMGFVSDRRWLTWRPCRTIAARLQLRPTVAPWLKASSPDDGEVGPIPCTVNHRGFLRSPSGRPISLVLKHRKTFMGCQCQKINILYFHVFSPFCRVSLNGGPTWHVDLQRRNGPCEMVCEGQLQELQKPGKHVYFIFTCNNFSLRYLFQKTIEPNRPIS